MIPRRLTAIILFSSCLLFIQWGNFAYPQSRIIFVSDEGKESNLYLLNPDSKTEQKITNRPAEVRQFYNHEPSVSRDGKKIAYASYRIAPDEGLRLWKKWNGQPLFPSEEFYIYGYSYYPSRTYYTRLLNFNWNIYMYDLTTKKERQISAFPWDEFSPEWMKRGSGVLYSLRAEKSTFVLHGKTSGADFRQITLRNNEAIYPDISPDGRTVVYQSYTGYNWEIFTLKLTEKFPESSKKQLTHTSHVNEIHPVWSPDGKRILFVANYRGGDNYDLYVMNPEDGKAAPVTAEGNIAAEYAWSPDGKRIAYTSLASGRGDIFVVEVEGGKKTPIAVSTDNERFPAWSPDGASIAFLKRSGRNYYLFSISADCRAASPYAAVVSSTPKLSLGVPQCGDRALQLSSTPCFLEPVVWFGVND